MISHRHAELLVAEAIDFNLAAADARQVAEHLASCDACAAHAAALNADAERVRQLPRHHAPPRVRAALEEAASRDRPRLRLRTQLLLAAALLLGLVGAALLVGALVQRPDDLVPDWAAAPVAPNVAGATQGRIHAVTWGEDGFVAVGASPLGAATWHSVDGESWARGDDADLPPGMTLLDVAASGTGYAALGTLDARTAVCDSDTGIAWQCTQPTGIDGMGQAIASHGGDLVVVGSSIWYRPGNGAWRGAAVPAGQIDRLVAVTWTGSGFVAIGLQPFTSPDGRSWESDPSGDVMGAADLVASPDRLVVVGAAGGRPQAWVGTGARNLQPSPALPGSGAMFGVVFARGLFAAVGDGAAGATAWTSADGRAWTDALVAGEAGSRMLDVATNGDRVVAVGSRGTEAAAWRYGEKR